MSEHERNLGTFQNLCIIALSDGALHEDERILLQDLAMSMGLNDEDALRMMQQASRMELVIPEGEVERQMELRLVVLMVIADGEIDEREYELCLQLAEQMEIEREYLDTLITFYLEKQQEKISHLSIFQNLYIIAAADGRIDDMEHSLLLEVADNLGLNQEDIDFIIDHYADLQLIIPEDKEEGYFSLKNLVYMMIVDGEISPEEYRLCLEFAEEIGLDKKAIEKILEEYENLRSEEDVSQTEILHQNIDTYLDVFNGFDKIFLSVPEMVKEIEQVFHYQKFDIFDAQSEAAETAFYQFMWLAMVRGIAIYKEMWMMLPIMLDLVKRNGHFKALKDFMIETEKKHGNTVIELEEKSVAAIQQELAALFV